MTKSNRILSQLRKFESPNVTFLDPDGTWPIVWQRARGMHVWDEDGRKYLDLTAAFGVAAAGHANAAVVRAGRQQMGELLHAMGDVHPHALKAQLARELSRVTFERWFQPAGGKTTGTARTIFCNSGFEAVEAAIKTALLATLKQGVLAFERGYHGLGYGALNVTHRDLFRDPFLKQLGGFGTFVKFPCGEADLAEVEQLLMRHFETGSIGAVVVEPIQVRGGMNIPPEGFLPLLRRLCDRFGALLILDEIYTGFGRTGKWFACETSKTIPDLICLGKALTGGFPLSACVGKAEVMERAWPPSHGEAIHTSTFLGHPVGCAMALAQLKELREHKLVAASAQAGKLLLTALKQLDRVGAWQVTARGRGLLIGVEVSRPGQAPNTEDTIQIVKDLLKTGYLVLPEGESGNVIGITPPLIITGPQIEATVKALKKVLEATP